MRKHQFTCLDCGVDPAARNAFSPTALQYVIENNAPIQLIWILVEADTTGPSRRKRQRHYGLEETTAGG